MSICLQPFCTSRPEKFPLLCAFWGGPKYPLNNTGFVSQPIYGEGHHDNMANRLKAAGQLAKKNNMDFRNDYIKRYIDKVNTHSFKEGQLVYLQRPEMVKINPKLQSEWFGPFVILSMVGEHNSLIQDLASCRTKFVNCNRLRAYNLTSEEWKKFKFGLARQDSGDMHSTDQQTSTTKSDNATSGLCTV